MRPLLFVFLCVMSAMCLTMGHAQVPLYMDPDAPIDTRVQDLLGRMTLAEKASLWKHGSPAIERLGVPAYDWWSEGLHGVARAGYATVFPQAIGLASMWDPALMESIGAAIGDEARAKHHDFVRRGQRGQNQGLSFWSPNINLFRDPRWGRGMETYGEDPFLTGKTGAAFIRGLQGTDPRYFRVTATMKHFAVHSGPESERHTFNAVPSVRDVRESYLPHFRMCVTEAHVQSVMCAYNRFAGAPCCGSNTLLESILRREWGFDGYVTSDCGAIEDIFKGHKIASDVAGATALAIRAGTDLACAWEDAAPEEAVKSGLLSELELDRSIARLLKARIQLGMFDPPERVPYAATPINVLGSAAHRALALEAARKSIVLLKNDGHVLPLRGNARSIAVIGPNANDVLSLLGNYYGTPDGAVTPLEGIKQRAGSSTEVLYAAATPFAGGTALLEPVPAGSLSHREKSQRIPGLHAEYFRGGSATGVPAVVRTDSTIDFTWCRSLPLNCGDSTEFSVRWTGEIQAPFSGTFHLGTFGFRSFRIVLGDSVVAHASWGSEMPDYASLRLEQGKWYALKIEATCRASGNLVQFLWEVPDPQREKKALALARKADITILVLGLSPRVEGEEMSVEVKGFHGGDRTDIALPESQRHLLRSVIALGKPFILVLMNGSALALPEIAHTPAIVEAWYPGQSGGTALAEILFGDVNPSGRLPVTFYASTSDLPPFSEYSMHERTYRFFSGKPLYPFGHGLSYTSFAYKNLSTNVGNVPRDTARVITVRAEITNTGARAGDEVAQMYVRAVKSAVARPRKDLRAFRRISISPGCTVPVEFTLNPADCAYYDDRSERWIVESGEYEIQVGSSSEDIRLSTRITLR